jgi:DNA-directed RNA polymerase subunit RPC12/RpoP
MAQKTVGYVELEWECPNCGNRNKGSQKLCSGCGAAQPADVKFQQPAEEKLIEKQDPSEAVPDIHCSFCGVRNPGKSAVCSNCGGDLSDAQKRETGRILGAHRDQPADPIRCQACGEDNSPANLRCARCGAALSVPQAAPSAQSASKKTSPIILYILAGVGLVLVILLVVSLFSRKDVTAIVDTRSWERSIEIEKFGPISQAAWEQDLPAEARNISCEDRYYATDNQPAPKSTEVCGTPYTVDQGDGTGKVVQDCQYEIYASYCDFTIDGWTAIRVDKLAGSDEPPTWPATDLATDQREGERAERYVILFSLDGKTTRYVTSDVNLFLQASPGSRWILSMNGLGDIIDIAPGK